MLKRPEKRNHNTIDKRETNIRCALLLLGFIVTMLMPSDQFIGRCLEYEKIYKEDGTINIPILQSPGRKHNCL